MWFTDLTMARKIGPNLVTFVLNSVVHYVTPLDTYFF